MPGRSGLGRLKFRKALSTAELVVNHTKKMKPIILENHSEKDVNVKKILDRIIRYQKSETLSGLNEILIIDDDESANAFGCYRKSKRKIEIYIKPTLESLPWILKRTYIFPFWFVSMVVAHELDHHVNRDNGHIDKEKSAEENMMKYIYPALGVFKPMVKITGKILFALKKNGYDTAQDAIQPAPVSFQLSTKE